MVTLLGSASSKEILNSITPLLISADLAVRNSICDVLDAVAANDSSMVILVTQGPWNILLNNSYPFCLES